MPENHITNGPAVNDGTLPAQSYGDSPRLRLYTLLDTLVAARMDMTRLLDHEARADGSGDVKLRNLRGLLDTAIASTRDIIALVGNASTIVVAPTTASPAISTVSPIPPTE